jgi:hypothetical protein
MSFSMLILTAVNDRNQQVVDFLVVKKMSHKAKMATEAAIK